MAKNIYKECLQSIVYSVDDEYSAFTAYAAMVSGKKLPYESDLILHIEDILAYQDFYIKEEYDGNILGSLVYDINLQLKRVQLNTEHTLFGDGTDKNRFHFVRTTINILNALRNFELLNVSSRHFLDHDLDSYRTIDIIKSFSQLLKAALDDE